MRTSKSVGPRGILRLPSLWSRARSCLLVASLPCLCPLSACSSMSDAGSDPQTTAREASASEESIRQLVREELHAALPLASGGSSSLDPPLPTEGSVRTMIREELLAALQLHSASTPAPVSSSHPPPTSSKAYVDHMFIHILCTCVHTTVPASPTVSPQGHPLTACSRPPPPTCHAGSLPNPA